MSNYEPRMVSSFFFFFSYILQHRFCIRSGNNIHSIARNHYSGSIRHLYSLGVYADASLQRAELIRRAFGS